MSFIIRYMWVIIPFLFLSPAHAQEKLTLCSADSPPWTIQKSKSPSDIEGLAVDIMDELFKRAGADIHLVALPFKRCLENTKSGELDGCFMTIKNKEREQYAEFSDSYLEIPTYVYFSPDKFGQFEWNSWEDLKPYKIGVQRGFKYGPSFTTASKNMPLRIVEVSDVTEGAGMLLLGRIDLLLINEFRYDYLLLHHPEFRGKLSRAQRPVGIGHVHIAISKRSPSASLIPKLNAVIQEMTSDGTIQKIVHPK